MYLTTSSMRNLAPRDKQQKNIGNTPLRGTHTRHLHAPWVSIE